MIASVERPLRRNHVMSCKFWSNEDNLRSIHCRDGWKAEFNTERCDWECCAIVDAVYNHHETGAKLCKIVHFFGWSTVGNKSNNAGTALVTELVAAVAVAFRKVNFVDNGGSNCIVLKVGSSISISSEDVHLVSAFNQAIEHLGTLTLDLVPHKLQLQLPFYHQKRHGFPRCALSSFNWRRKALSTAGSRIEPGSYSRPCATRRLSLLKCKSPPTSYLETMWTLDKSGNTPPEYRAFAQIFRGCDAQIHVRELRWNRRNCLNWSHRAAVSVVGHGAL